MNRLEQIETCELTEQGPTWFDRSAYLIPTRYFHFYLFKERRTGGTCWLPEGFTK
jgi:hypothetical protein